MKKSHKKQKTVKVLNAAKVGGLQQSSNAGKRPWLAPYKWKKGQSGNISGKRAGEVSVTAALRRLLAQGSTVDELAQAILAGVTERFDGSFARIILDRIDGPIQQQMTGTLFQPVIQPTQVQIIIPPNGRDPIPTIEIQSGPAALPPAQPQSAAVPEPIPPVTQAQADAGNRARLEAFRAQREAEKLAEQMERIKRTHPAQPSEINPFSNGPSFF